MATADIDSLQIEIGASSADATQQINELTKALQRLRRNANKGTGLEKVQTELKGIRIQTGKTTKAFGAIKKSLGAIGYMSVVRYLGSAVQSVNAYVENINLFQVSMGEFYDEAFSYAQLVSEKLGVDPSQWMRNQGVFMSMANGFNMARDQAYALGEGLTELSYDLSSLYNEDMDRSALRLQSALSGEIEPIRRLGISITQATLQEYAFSKGINESVANMTEQEKALLRSLALIEGAGRIGAIGDFAKTLESPANAMRVLNQQMIQFKRAIGSVLLPVIVQLLPYMQALVSLTTEWINRLAVLVGFEIPTWETSDWAEAASQGADAFGEAAESAKKMKDHMLGIDELNVISPSSETGAASSGLSSWAADLEVPDLWDKDAIEAIKTKAEELKKPLEKVLSLALLIGAAFATWTIAPLLVANIGPVVKGVQLLATSISTLGITGGLTAALGISVDVAAAFSKIVALAPPMLAILFVIISTLKVVRDKWDEIKGAIAKALEISGVNEKVQEIKKKLGELGVSWDGLKNAVGKVMDFIGSTVVIVLGSTLVGAFNLVVTAIGGLITIAQGIIGVFSGIGQFLKGTFIDGDIETARKGISEFADGVAKIIQGVGLIIVDGISGFIKGFMSGFVELFKVFTGVDLPKFANKIMGIFNLVVDGAKTIGSNFVKNLWNGILSLGNWLWDHVKSFFGKAWNAVSSAFEGFGGRGLTTIGITAIPAFANGGFPDHGQAFIARENGPELVGQIGRRSAVVNNDQIVESVTDGVYQGVLSALAQTDGGSGGQFSFNIYLDGKQIDASLEKVRRHKGVKVVAGGYM